MCNNYEGSCWLKSKNLQLIDDGSNNKAKGTKSVP